MELTKSVKSWPSSERPRERLFSQGVAALSNAELLAILLGSGTKNKNIRQDATVQPSQILVDSSIAGRDYQIEAIKRVCDQLAQNKRKFLLLMATGTGKTRTAMALIDVLLRGNWVNWQISIPVPLKAWGQMPPTAYLNPKSLPNYSITLIAGWPKP